MVLLKMELICFSLNKCLVSRNQGTFFAHSLKCPHSFIPLIGSSIVYQKSPRILLERTLFSKVLAAHNGSTPGIWPCPWMCLWNIYYWLKPLVLKKFWAWIAAFLFQMKGTHLKKVVWNCLLFSWSICMVCFLTCFTSSTDMQQQ